MDCIERLIGDIKQELQDIEVPEHKEEDLRLVKDYLRMADYHYKKLKGCPRKIKRGWYIPPAL